MGPAVGGVLVPVPLLLLALLPSPSRCIGRANAWPASLATGAGMADPVKIVDQLESALSAGNLEAALAWCDPALVIREGPAKEISDREQVRDYLSAMIRHRYRVVSLSRSPSGNRVAFTSRVSFDDLKAMGVDAVDARGEAVVLGGKVKVYAPAFCPGSILLLGSAAAKSAESLVRSLADDVWGGGNPAAAEKYLGPGFTDHNPFPASGTDRDGFMEGLTKLRSALPDLQMTVEQTVTTGDTVVVRGVVTGTHQGSYLDKPPTFRHIRIEMIEILRIEDGKVVERWAQFDALGFSRDMGLLEPTVKTKAKAAAKEGGTGGIMGWFFNLF